LQRGEFQVQGRAEAVESLSASCNPFVMYRRFDKVSFRHASKYYAELMASGRLVTTVQLDPAVRIQAAKGGFHE
jgi:hypothetical protein